MNALGSLAFEPLPEGMFWSLYWSLLHVGPVTQAIDESADDSGGFGMYDPSHSNYGPSDDYGAYTDRHFGGEVEGCGGDAILDRTVP
jgi:hypothetical protein